MATTAFISYSWDSEEHKDWVRKLADYLQNNGIEIILDQYDLSTGKNMTLFMESSIEKADKVLLILTPNFKLKSDSRHSGVGYEYSMISAELFEIQHDNNKFIPILRAGDKNISTPKFLTSFVHHDMKRDDRFISDAFELIRIIVNKPKIIKPKLGALPDFEQEEKDPIAEIATAIVSQQKLQRQKEAYIDSREAAEKCYTDLHEAFSEIEKKATEYREKTGLFFRAEYKQWRLILISEGLCLNIFLSNYSPGYLEKAELIITVWDKPLGLNNNIYYFKGDEPIELGNITFIPKVNDRIEIVWASPRREMKLTELKTFAFEMLLEYVKKAKNIH